MVLVKFEKPSQVLRHLEKLKKFPSCQILFLHFFQIRLRWLISSIRKKKKKKISRDDRWILTRQSRFLDLRITMKYQLEYINFTMGWNIYERFCFLILENPYDWISKRVQDDESDLTNRYVSFDLNIKKIYMYIGGSRMRMMCTQRYRDGRKIDSQKSDWSIRSPLCVITQRPKAEISSSRDRNPLGPKNPKPSLFIYIWASMCL